MKSDLTSYLFHLALALEVVDAYILLMYSKWICKLLHTTPFAPCSRVLHDVAVFRLKSCCIIIIVESSTKKINHISILRWKWSEIMRLFARDQVDALNDIAWYTGHGLMYLECIIKLLCSHLLPLMPLAQTSTYRTHVVCYRLFVEQTFLALRSKNLGIVRCYIYYILIMYCEYVHTYSHLSLLNPQHL